MKRRPLIIDTDPGVDDAIAILLALASPELDLLGICAVAGNVPLAATQDNARRICELAGRPDIPVYAGCPRPMLREQIFGKYSGVSGLGGTLLPPPSMPLMHGHAVDFLLDTLDEAAQGRREKVTICAIGPRTDLGVVFSMRPSVVRGIERLVIMGGAFSALGNRTPSAEYNILADPHAARIVFSSGAPITLAPLDMTFRALAKPEWVASLKALKRRVASVAAELITFYDRNDPERYGEVGGPLHDPTTVAWLLRPEFFTGRDVFVDVDCEGHLTLGHTQADWRGKTGCPANAHVLTGIDAPAFFAFLKERLAAYE